MAVIDIHGRWHGRAAGLVYRSVGGKNIVQGRPRKFKQTLATRESGLEFGLASNTARILREILWPAYHSVDKGMVNRLTSTVLKSISGSQEYGRGERDLHNGDLGCLHGFQFNKNSPLTEMLPQGPEVRICNDGKPELRLPSFTPGTDVKYPIPDYKAVTIRFMAIAVHFRSEYYEYLDCRDIQTNRGVRLPEQVWKVEKELPPGCLILLTVSMFAVATKAFSDMMLNSKEWSPAQIVYAMQVPEEETGVSELVSEEKTVMAGLVPEDNTLIQGQVAEPDAGVSGQVDEADTVRAELVSKENPLIPGRVSGRDAAVSGQVRAADTVTQDRVSEEVSQESVGMPERGREARTGMTEQESVGGNSSNNSAGRPTIEGSTGPFGKKPIGSYWGRDTFHKFRKLWEREAAQEEKKAAADTARKKKWIERLQQKHREAMADPVGQRQLTAEGESDGQPAEDTTLSADFQHVQDVKITTGQPGNDVMKENEPQNGLASGRTSGLTSTPALPHGKIRFGKKGN